MYPITDMDRENVLKALQGMGFVLSDLQQANRTRNALLDNTVLDILTEAAALETRLKRLLYAIQERA